MNREDIWTVTPVLTGKFGMVRDDIKYRNGDSEIEEYVPSVLFLLENGRDQVVVDTGFAEPDVCAEKLGLLVERNGSYKELLKETGIIREHVRTVIFTHLHWDHAGNAEYFPNAIFYCQKREWMRAETYPQEYPPLWLSYLKNNKEKLELLDGNGRIEIIPGISVQYTGGHTYGSQIIFIETCSGTEIIAGDVVMTERNLKQLIPVGLCVNEAECEQALQIIKESGASRVYPSHDFSLWNGR